MRDNASHLPRVMSFSPVHILPSFSNQIVGNAVEEIPFLQSRASRGTMGYLTLHMGSGQLSLECPAMAPQSVYSLFTADGVSLRIGFSTK